MEKLLIVQNEKLDQIVKAYKNFKKSPKDRITMSYVETKLECVDKLYADFKTGHTEIVSIVDADEKPTIPYFSEDINGSFEEHYAVYTGILKDALRPLLANQNLQQTPPPTAPNTDIKLPRIQLPVFSGRYQEWQTFYDMFVSLIHNNVTISPVQKLHYLKGSLSGEPENLLRNLTTELNYTEAWKQLTKRYNNKRYNCNAIMKTLFGQKQIHGESACSIRQLLDTTSSALKSLDNIGVDTKSWDIIILYLVVSKLDPESHKQWEIKVSETSTDDLPTWNQLCNFLETRFRTLEMIDASKTVTKSFPTPTSSMVKPKAFHSSMRNEKTAIVCTFCSGHHFLYQCKEFGKKTPHERQEFVQTNKLCFNCLAPFHAVIQCHQSSSCRKCGRRHHSLLHFDKTEIKGTTNLNTESTNTGRSKIDSQYQPRNVESEINVVANYSGESPLPCKILLATAKIRASSENGNQRLLRALIDQGSQGSFVTEETAQLLGLKKIRINGSVSGIGEGRMQIKYMVRIIIQSCRDPDFKVCVQAYVLNQLTSVLPTEKLDKLDWLQFEELSLADPGFSTPSKIDILLGADVYCEILLAGMLKSPKGNLIAQNTTLGWILSGKTSTKSMKESDNDVINMHIQIKEDIFLKKFWELEAEPNAIEKRLSKEEVKCEELYDSTSERDHEGRFVVKLPFDSDDPQCQYGKLREISYKRYQFLERKLARDPKLCEEYNRVLQEYIELDHMREVSEDKIKDPTAVYLPHHAVVRENKETTKVRVVFDASCAGVNGISLNNNLLVGPKLQDDLRHILMRWRSHKIVLVADIVKMYRQVRVTEEDTRYQRILWKPNRDEPIKHYELLTLTFGTASAPYLAVKSLQRLAEDESTKYPLAACITNRDFYVDDLMTGCNNDKEAKQIYKEMNKLMSAGGFELQKWSSNSSEILQHIDQDKIDKNQAVPIKIDDLVKVLGMNWNRVTDNFEYSVNLPLVYEPITKRKVLSDIARLYDPMGWIAPVVINAKIFIQNLWRANLPWDESLPEGLLSHWLKFRENLQIIQNVCVPRWNHVTPDAHNELHAFSDASQSAFAAVVYIRSTDQYGKIKVSLVTAKTKVSPIEKEISIPRLELSGAVIASRLLYEVSQKLNIPKENLHA